MNLNLERAVRYHYDSFPPKCLHYGQFVDQLVAATDAVARYDQMMKNMHNSEILKYEAEQDDEGQKNTNVRSEVIETFLYLRALRNAQRAMEEGHPFSLSLIKGIHQQLLSIGRGATQSPGQLKSEQNYLADAGRRNILFIPVSPEKLQDGLDDLFAYIGESNHPALIKAALAHIEFEALHPFKDGNGRIGRMIITLMLWSSGTISAPHFYVSSYLEDYKDQYIETMRNVSKDSDWDEWCKFFLIAIEQQAIRNLEIAENIRALYEAMKITFSDVLASKWSMAALDFLFTNPVFRNSRFTRSSGIPSASAARFTRALLENELLVTVEEPAGRRPGLYSFEPLMRLVRV